MNNNEQEKAVASNRRQKHNTALVGSSHLHVCEIISKRSNYLYCLLNLFTNRVMRNVDKIIDIFAQRKNRKSFFSDFPSIFPKMRCCNASRKKIRDVSRNKIVRQAALCCCAFTQS